MRTLLTLLANLAAQHDTSRPQPRPTIYRFAQCADGTYRERRIIAEDSRGFVDMDTYATVSEAEDAMKRAEDFFYGEEDNDET